ncbi:MAG: CopD family protein [Euryarchaeota archaeon]|nr:CopD family protein [Euryarchaeota archaeon]MDE1835196.1 CopD family protein [Euryarchaeota archaeon]MDE1880054.1 CopD family protein [Euryarchaeota archaeon]MDE2045738.1 CopD family protein [Thermoplasmata archaeon]
MELLDTVILFVHLLSAVLFIGGSFFLWLVVMPLSRQLAPDEAARTVLVGKIARGFAKWSNATLLLLVVTGLYNASWYLAGASPLARELLEIKVALVGVLVLGIYAHGLYYGRKISRLAKAGDVQGLQAVRKRSRPISYLNLALMVAILVVVALMQTMS